MNKPFKFGMIIGRFQHLHEAHKTMIESGLTSCENLLVLVGSSQEAYTKRNPFNLKTRMDVIREVFDEERFRNLRLGHIDDMTHEDDHSTDWGKYVLEKVDMWRQHYGIEDQMDCMIFGDDEERMSWFDPKDVEGVSRIILARNDNDLSATKMREHLKNDDYLEWVESVPFQIANDYWFDRLRDELLDVEFYKGMIESE